MSFNSGGVATAAAGSERHMFLPLSESRVVFDVRRHISPGTHKKSWDGTATITDEDHTLGQMLRHALVLDPRVVTAGYLIPHPLEPFIKVRILTVDSCKPRDAMDAAIDRCVADLSTLQATLNSKTTTKQTPQPVITTTRLSLE